MSSNHSRNEHVNSTQHKVDKKSSPIVKPQNSERSTDLIERKMIKQIIAGEYANGTVLPSERDLAKLFQVGRPTIREVLQRLESGGWITSRTGMPAIVNNYWEEGNLTTLVSMIEQEECISEEFIYYLLELRIALTPVYIKEAVNYQQAKVIALLANLEQVEDTSHDYASFDWHLQKELAGLSPNPIYRLILNSLDRIYLRMAEHYFTDESYRQLSRTYYEQLLHLTLKGDAEAVEQLVTNTMQKSMTLWKQGMTAIN